MKKPIIEVKNLTKKFKGRVVLDNINLKVYQGESFGLLGPNGAGKTTLINILLGIIEAEEGEIRIFGLPLEKNLSRISQGVNLASAYTRLQEQITLVENLLTFAGLYGIKNPKAKIEQLIKFFNLEQLIKQRTKVMTLSSGEKTRLTLCKALLNDPEILFLDEPTASLDPGMKKKVQNLILKIQKQRKLTIFYASHDLTEAKRFCNRFGFLKRGKLIKTAFRKDLKKLLKMYQEGAET